VVGRSPEKRTEHQKKKRKKGRCTKTGKTSFTGGVCLIQGRGNPHKTLKLGGVLSRSEACPEKLKIGECPGQVSTGSMKRGKKYS